MAFFTSRGMSVSDKNEDEVIRKGLELLRSDSMQEAMRRAQREHGKPDAARRICEFIMAQEDTK